MNLSKKIKSLHPYTKMLLCGIVAFIILICIIYTIGYTKGKHVQKDADNIILTETVTKYENQYNELMRMYQIAITAEDVQIHSEAEYLAKLLYGQARTNSPDAQRAICWLVINRTENKQFPNSIKEVVEQPSQWMGYSENNVIEQNLYDIAADVISDWHNLAYRPISPDYLYMSWSKLGITIRTDYIETNATQYLYFK